MHVLLRRLVLYLISESPSWRREDPPPDALTKFYKCHPQTRVGAVVCILCLNFYHTNVIVSKYNSGCPVKIINKALIICPDHPKEALTLNIPYGTLRNDARQLIAHIILSTWEQIKQEIIIEINLEKINKTHNEIVYEDYSKTESLKIENQLLKQLNIKLQHKNKILY